MSHRHAERFDVAAVSCGRDHTLALLAAGKVIGWGGDGSGRIPSGMPEYCTTPAPTRPVEVLLREPLDVRRGRARREPRRSPRSAR